VKLLLLCPSGWLFELFFSWVVVLFWAPSSSVCGGWVGGWVGKMALLLLLLLLFCEAAKEWVVIQSVCLTVCSDGDVLSGAV